MGPVNLTLLPCITPVYSNTRVWYLRNSSGDAQHRTEPARSPVPGEPKQTLSESSPLVAEYSMDASHIDAETIEAWVGPAAFRRSSAYVCSPQLADRTQKGDLLTADVYGTLPDPYKTSVRLGEDGLLDSACTCPVGYNGDCKHVAALVLTWLREPQSFSETRAVEEMLNGLSRSELIALVEQLIDAEPQLKSILKLNALARQEAFDPVQYRRQITSVLERLGPHLHPRDGGHGLLRQLDNYLHLAETQARTDQWRDAGQIAALLAEEVSVRYDTLYDREGNLIYFVVQAVQIAGEALMHLRDTNLRLRLLRSLFIAFREDVLLGGYGMGDKARDILVEQTSPEERQRVIEWVEEALSQVTFSDEPGSNYKRRSFGAVILDLTGDTLDDDAFVQQCLETDRREDAVDRLLSVGRTDEAVEFCRDITGYYLLNLARVFESHERADAILPLVLHAGEGATDARIHEWIVHYYERREHYRDALRWQRTLFTSRPSADRYARALQLASTLGIEENVRSALMDEVEQENDVRTLTRMHLHDGHVQAAFETLNRLLKTRRGSYHVSPEPLIEDVAEAAAETHPHISITLKKNIIERAIRRRGRPNYKYAAQELVQLRDYHRKNGKSDDWVSYIYELRQRHNNLPALKDELKKANV